MKSSQLLWWRYSWAQDKLYWQRHTQGFWRFLLNKLIGRWPMDCGSDPFQWNVEKTKTTFENIFFIQHSEYTFYSIYWLLLKATSAEEWETEISEKRKNLLINSQSNWRKFSNYKLNDLIEVMSLSFESFHFNNWFKEKVFSIQRDCLKWEQVVDKQQITR